jgi:hypothetical protein
MTAVKPERPGTERPNTVAGLEAKKAELEKLRDQLESDLRNVVSDIDHLDGALRLFGVQQTRERYVRQYRAKKGSVRRFVLTALRDASGPVTSKMPTEAWCEARGLTPDDATWRIIRNRLTVCAAAAHSNWTTPASCSGCKVILISPSNMGTGAPPRGACSIAIAVLRRPAKPFSNP